MDYRETLNLPTTDFPMKADLPTREPQIQKFWEEQQVYRRSLQRGGETFILHDGPPYSNGNIHLGHALNKILKDVIVKYKTMQGFSCPYVPGWDNHGLPIEVEVMKEFRARKQAWTPVEMRRRCREFAAEWVERQRAQFQRLGVRGDWEHPYLTMSPSFEAKIVEVFAALAAKGYVYRGLKPVFWDPANETALANTEAEYKDHVSPAIYVTFPYVEGTSRALDGLDGGRLAAVIWTTTPWTIPANLALAFHPDFEYAVVRTESGDLLLVAQELVPATVDACDLGPVEVVRTLPGRAIEHARFRHPLPELDRESLAVLAESYITTDTGTGIVHTAPGHGADDYNTGRKYDLPILSIVDARGRYNEDAGPFAGLTTDEANERVPERLREAGMLLAQAPYSHSYPHSPRAPYKPLLFRATVQWFISVDHERLRERAVAEIERVRWFPPQSENRIRAAVEGRPDWTISRQRYWGVGIPVFYANDEPVLTEESLAAVVRLVRERGTDAWYDTPPEEILPPGFCYNGVAAKDFVKETDVLDVWFDSGSTGMAVLDSGEWPLLRWPADVYLEGSDQHKSWFNASLTLATAVKGGAPYRQVVTHGFTVDERGYKQSKSRGNAVDPLGVIEQVGADVLRLWVGSVEYHEDTRLGENILKQVVESYRRVRNTLRFLLGALHDFAPGAHRVAGDDLVELDRWALHRLQLLIEEVTHACDVYEFHRAMRAILDFCTLDLSAFYLDVIKDRLYASAPDDGERRSAQTALYEIASALMRMLSPVLSHTAEEAWQMLPAATASARSVELAPFPETNAAYRLDDASADRWRAVLALRDDVNKALENARQTGTVKKSLEAKVTLVGVGDAAAGFSDEALATLFLVSLVERREGGSSILVEPAEGVKCARCWLVRRDIGQDTAHPDLCARCAAALDRLSAARNPAGT